MNLTGRLNPRQREAVEWTEGPLLILAGAGSGKTRVITHRIAYLIKEKGVLPWRILALTFTNKAAAEMKRRVEALLGGRLSSDIWISTFHAACARILRQEIARLGYSSHFLIYDSADQLDLIRECLRELNINRDLYPARRIAARISRLKNQLLTPEAYAASGPFFGLEEQVRRVYALYQQKLKERDALDFDDLLMLTVRLWETYPEVLHAYQNRFRYILVDEYQDTNRVQYHLLALLTQTHRNICVVGDDDQGIYGWRGATIENILSFEEQFPGCKVIRLEENYRSTRTILEAANQVIRHNRHRKRKTLWTQRPAGKPLHLFIGETEIDEADFVCATIKDLCHSGPYHFSDMAILYRTNAQSRVFEDALRRERIPYQIVGGLRFYDRKEVKDILAYLRLIVNPQDTVSLQRIINLPPRGIGRVTLERLFAAAGTRQLSPFDVIPHLDAQSGIPAGTRRKLEGFYHFIQECRTRMATLPPARLVEEVLERSGYLAMLEKGEATEAEARIENIKELISAADVFTLQNPEASLTDFLDQTALISDQDLLEEGKGGVVLMTLHTAKGLEFPVVFMVGMEEGLFPHARSLHSEAEREEERRLCYVGITRAKEELYFTAAEYRRIYGTGQHNPLSPFLEDIDPSLVQLIPAPSPSPPPLRPVLVPSPQEPEERFVPGALVRHQEWGVGVIRAREGRGEETKLTIVFRSVGKKRVMVKYAPLELLES
ncbi:MAG: DUF3553 domain-containing protein [Nitrospinota bacterium]|nr:MAG: DUF3553 domain-containing protein [Nitrospinota bacterium]